MTRAVELLEPRRLLAATLGDNGTLEILGTGKADTIYVTYGPDALDKLTVRINRDISVFQSANVKRITFSEGRRVSQSCCL